MDWGWAFDGVNQTIPRNAGPDCSHYLTWRRQIIESIAVTSISIFVIHWIWKRLAPCFNPNEEHLLILQQRFYDASGSGGGAGRLKVVKQQHQQQGGYFGNTAPPPLILPSGVGGDSDKSALSAVSGGGAAEGCHNTNCDSKDENGVCRVHFNFNVNTGYCVNNSSSAAQSGSCGNPGSVTDGAYQQQQQQRVHGAEVQPVFNEEMAAARIEKIFVGKQVLLVLMTFVLGLELGFKFASRTVIYLLNPCHITTIMQVRGMLRGCLLLSIGGGLMEDTKERRR